MFSDRMGGEAERSASDTVGKKMERVAGFEKVSFERFAADYREAAGDPAVTDAALFAMYQAIRLPVRATAGSAGYDFFLPFPVRLEPGQGVKIVTGIRARIAPGWVLMNYPKSGLGFRFRLQLDNTVGVIDSDYYGSDNEGHIMAKLTNDSRDGRIAELAAGRAFMQGVFMPFGITEDDSAEGIRNGGFGSTEK